MRICLSSVTSFMLLFFAGCLSPPPAHVVPVTTITNNAMLTYAYGGAARFQLQSPPVDIVALAPVSSGDVTYAAAGKSSMNVAAMEESSVSASNSVGIAAPATIERKSIKSASGASFAQAKIRQNEAGAYRKEMQAATSTTKTAAAELHKYAVTRGRQEETSGGSSMRQQFAGASETTRAENSSISATDFAGSGSNELYSSEIRLLTACARINSSCARASSAWSTRQPTIRKWATRRNVVIGDRFEYVIEVHNGTPLDLTFAEISDLLDYRLLIESSGIRTISHTKTKVHLTDRRLSVKFPDGIGHGQTARILIPVILRMDYTNRQNPAR